MRAIVTIVAGCCAESCSLQEVSHRGSLWQTLVARQPPEIAATDAQNILFLCGWFSKLEGPFVTGVLIMRVRLFGVYIRASDFWKLPHADAPI